MPISFTCPHCGTQSQVADQYAGQSGPCSKCGKPITIPRSTAPLGSPLGAPLGGFQPLPAASFPNYPQPQASSSGTSGLKILVIVLGVFCVGLLFCGGIAVALLLPAISSARQAARSMQSQNNLRQISLALHNYEDTYRTLPPAIVRDANGKPLYSGLVLLLPFLEQSSVASQWKLDEPWDSPNNLPLSSLTLPVFRNANVEAKSPGQGDYMLVGGPGSALDPLAPSRKFSDMTDGTSNTIMAIETMPTRSWAEPNAWASGMPTYSSNGMGPSVAMGDGSVRRLPKNIPAETLRALETRAGNEVVNLE